MEQHYGKWGKSSALAARAMRTGTLITHLTIRQDFLMGTTCCHAQLVVARPLGLTPLLIGPDHPLSCHAQL